MSVRKREGGYYADVMRVIVTAQVRRLLTNSK